MSAPDTNLEKQKRRHRGPLVGMAIVLVAVGVLFVIYLLAFADDAQPPVTATDTPAAITEAPADPANVTAETEAPATTTTDAAEPPAADGAKPATPPADTTADPAAPATEGTEPAASPTPTP